jgi:hypothetical protein
MVVDESMEPPGMPIHLHNRPINQCSLYDVVNPPGSFDLTFASSVTEKSSNTSSWSRIKSMWSKPHSVDHIRSAPGVTVRKGIVSEREAMSPCWMLVIHLLIAV